MEKKEVVINPDVVKEDIVILMVGRNSNKPWEGIKLEVTNVYRSSGYFSVKAINGERSGTTNVYNGGTYVADEYCFFDRKIQAKYFKEKANEYETLRDSAKLKAESLEKFETEEEEIAFIIDELTKAKGVEAKAQIIAELRSRKLI